MRSESGQASVEWIGLVLILALGMAALVRFAPRADAGALGPELLHAIGCAARGGCEATEGGALGNDALRGGGPRLEDGVRPRAGDPRGMVSAPPLVPVAPRERPVPPARPRAPLLVRGRALVRETGRGAGHLWRRSWLLCLGYERARYGFLHPEVRFPLVPIPYSENLRMANDCISPVDLVRDWDLIRGPR
ncbi:MAG TPA: hypothetical protein VK486_12050 [Thermoleophilaceae bacterium]|nr:hypothetical protein [Thermoleophilaceae bacterium]